MNMIFILRAILSAILFLLSFFKPELFFWTSFISIFPLLQNVQDYQKREISRAQFLIAGIIFSFLVIQLHLIWFWKLLIYAGSSYKYLFGLITSGYFSLIIFLPFLASSFIGGKQIVRSVLFVTMFCGAVYFLAYRSFIIFGCNEGYFLFDPLAPLATLLPNENNHDKNIIALCPHSLAKGGCIRAHQLSTGLAKELFDKEGHCLIIFPESTFPYNLEEYQEFLPAWCDCHDNVDIIIGAHQQQGDKIFNCAYRVHNGGIKQVYKKQHLVPFFERIPAAFDKFGLGTVFSDQGKSFHFPEAHDENSDIFLINGVEYQIFICSELYQQVKPVTRKNIIFIGNNSWFMMHYANNLALLHARLFSYVHKIKIMMCLKN